jgi:hypothetical protein
VTVDSTRTFLSFVTNSPSFTVYVKGASGYDIYDYTGTTGHPAYPSDTGLHSPVNASRSPSVVGRYVVCGQPAAGKASPTLSTTPSAGGIVGSVVLNDSGTLAGGTSPTGSITFNLYNPSQTGCSGTPAFTQTVTVAGNGGYSTTNATPAATAGTWNWTASYTGDGNNNGAVSTCGQETVTVTGGVAQGSCQGSGSLSTLVSGTNVISYIPKGSWSGGTTGIAVVNVEGNSVTNTVIPTADVINSCASNSVTGQTVCTANNNQVYIVNGTTVANVLTDSGTGTIAFSGGSATTSGVSMDATNNKALLGISVGGVGGFQFLDLATDTFEPAFTTRAPSGEISEDPLIDPLRHLIVSASENNNVELADVTTSTSPQFFEHSVPSVSGVLDSSAEDCSTGIILAPAEGSNPSQVEIADINGAVSTPGSPGSWTVPEQLQSLTGSNLSAGANGSSVAQVTHTGVISGEFGGDGLTAIALPTTSGAGAIPAISNWVTCRAGADPAGVQFQMGFDPHTLIAYQSPATVVHGLTVFHAGDAIALMVNAGATEMVVVDLTTMLDPTSVPATGNVCDSSTLPASAERFLPLPAGS